ncbi:hypothetical protein PHOSAC3_150092 [Mesotoga infera]|nr:hypothetical protein PHOSAC3_150092 [Mesotoga infera]
MTRFLKLSSLHLVTVLFGMVLKSLVVRKIRGPLWFFMSSQRPSESWRRENEADHTDYVFYGDSTDASFGMFLH